MKKLDRIENEYLPQIKLDKTEVSSRFSVETAFSNNKQTDKTLKKSMMHEKFLYFSNKLQLKDE